MKKGLRIFALLTALCVLLSGLPALAECGYFSARNLLVNAMGMELDLTGLELVGKASVTDDGVAARLEADVNGECAFGVNLLADMDTIAVTADGMKNGITVSGEELLGFASASGLPVNDVNGIDFASVSAAVVADEDGGNAAMALVMPLMLIEPQDLGNQTVDMIYGTYECAANEIVLQPEDVDSILDGIFDLITALMNVEELQPLVKLVPFDVEEMRCELMPQISGMLSLTVDSYNCENGMMYTLDVAANGESVMNGSFVLDASSTESCGIASLQVGEESFTVSLLFNGAVFEDGCYTMFVFAVDDKDVLTITKSASDLTVEDATVEGDVLSVCLEVEEQTASFSVAKADLEDGRIYKNLSANVPDIADITADVFKLGNTVDVAVSANAEGMECLFNGTFEADTAEETVTVDNTGINLIDALSMDEDQSSALMEELTTVAMGALVKLASIPGVAALLG